MVKLLVVKWLDIGLSASFSVFVMLFKAGPGTLIRQAFWQIEDSFEDEKVQTTRGAGLCFPSFPHERITLRL